MELTNEFEVNVPVTDAWKVLTDVERIAPMLPGAQLQEVEGDEYRGVVKVKVGPITAQYKGKATFVERDEHAGRVVLNASGRDTRGQGNATAVITATMEPRGESTRVQVVTDLTVTGKVAQFGRGVMAEVSAKLMGQFVDSLHADLAAVGTGGSQDPPGDGTPIGAPAGAAPLATAGNSSPDLEPGWMAPSAAGSTAGDGAVRRIEGPEAEPVDLIAVAGGSALRRLLPLIGLLAVVAVVFARRRARKASAGLTERATSVAENLADKLPGR